MTRHLAFFVVFAAAAVSPAAASAQAKPLQVPTAYLPPKGMCRIWLDGVPADKQPAPTDCTTALRNKPATGQVVFPAAEPSKPVQNSALRQQSLPLPGNSLVSPARVPTVTRPATAGVRDTTKAKTDSAKARRDTVPKKPPPPPQ
jgi:hypothetical protein